MVAADLARACLCLGFLLVRSAPTVWVAYVLLAAMATFSAGGGSSAPLFAEARRQPTPFLATPTP